MVLDPLVRVILVCLASMMYWYHCNGSCAAGGDAQIKVIGVGGGGGNAINRMIASGLQVIRVVPCYAIDW